MEALMPADRYAEIFEPFRGMRVAYKRPIGNVGDRLIDLATYQLFRVFDITLSSIDEAQVVMWAGGGNMGRLYRASRERRMISGDQALRRRLPFVILPQSWTGPDEVAYCSRVYVRESHSRMFAPAEAVLMPDLALAFQVDFPIPAAWRDEGFFFRADKEAASQAHLARRIAGDPARKVLHPRCYVELAASCRHVHTDRLHFAIAALIAGRKVTLYRNSYHKNRAMWECWLKELGSLWGDEEVFSAK